ncbi:hypothetical protein E2C01_095606 [Portunus trituberculatus]|uniref:Uncharacterized protein n=1 Tax=Portunus trituberculatus TaxID=210409 RepID=A0A5B7JTF7_PORTR|nr:hypothetical protein [Portunus trituberculatus]
MESVSEHITIYSFSCHIGRETQTQRGGESLSRVALHFEKHNLDVAAFDSAGREFNTGDSGPANVVATII